MKTVKVHHYDVFSPVPNKGNPAGLVLTGEGMTDEEMQAVAKSVGFNETVFPLPSEVADLRLRFFTPGHEINLCGHGSVAGIFALKTSGALGDKMDLTVETNAGILPVHMTEDAEGHLIVTMRQAEPKFLPFEGSREALAASMGLTADDLDDALPIVYGNTGTWTLLVPIKTLDACRRMQPNNAAFPSILTELPRASVHPFTRETIDPAAQIHARHFSSPYSGTIEDPATGTASGVIGAYAREHLSNDPGQPLRLTIEQGQEVGRNGRIHVQVFTEGDKCAVEVAGTAVFVKEFDVAL